MIEQSVIPEPIAFDPAALAEAEYKKALQEKQRRDKESLRLYEPMPTQDAFHRCNAPEVIVIGSNRSGKTTTAMVELARAVTGQDPYNKYPKENGRVAVVGINQKHLAKVFYAKLFGENAFKIIKDKDTGKWRTFRRLDPGDLSREHEAEFAPPLIPDRMIEDISFENKKERIPSTVRLTNGWEMYFYTSNSEPPRGIDLDLVIFDEEVPNPQFYPELSARLGDRKGRFIWSATPQTGTEELFQLHERAIEDSASENPSVVEFHLDIRDNVFYPKEEIAKLIAKYKNSPEDYKVRILGQFNVTSYLIYPEFSMAREAHGCKSFDIPDDWNRWLVIDPGSAVCAVLFFAVPPQHHELGEQRFLYDELYITNCTAEKLAEHVHAKVAGRFFSGFLIDPSSTKQDKIGGGKSVFLQYADAFAAKGIESRQTGSSFTCANNEGRSGRLKMQSWLYHRPDTGRPVLQVFEDRCPNFEREFSRYRRKRRPDGTVLDEPVDKNDHTCDAARYFAMHDPNWEKQPEYKKRSFILEYFKKHQRDLAKENGDSRSIDFGTRVA